MDEFKPTFSNVEKDIERYLEQFGVRDTLSDGTPVIRGYDKAQQYILDRYYRQQAYDALVAHLLTFNWELGNGKLLLELSDALVRKKDVRRLKRLWHGVIAKQKMHFWQYQASPVVSDTVLEATARAKVRDLSGTLKTVRDMMLQLGEAQEAQKLNDDAARIEKEEKGKALPKPIDRSMAAACFWEIIEKTKKNASSSAEQIELLIAELELFKATEIGKFHKLLQQKMAELYHWDLWAVAYLAQVRLLPRMMRLKRSGHGLFCRGRPFINWHSKTSQNFLPMCLRETKRKRRDYYLRLQLPMRTGQANRCALPRRKR